MNRSAMSAFRSPARLLAPLLAPLLLVLSACNAAPPEQAPLAGAAIGGPFELVNKDGQTVRWADFAGKWRIVYFGYTFCPDVCPFDVRRLMQGFDQFAEGHADLAANIQPIFITIDPARDTPEKVGRYAAAFSPRLLGLTGTPEQVRAATAAFSVYAEKGPAKPDGSYMMDHSNAAFLMAPDGAPVALLPADESADAVAAELAKWVR